MQPQFEVFFDIETKTWFTETGTRKLEDLGVSIVCMYIRPEEQMLAFWEKDFDQMWQYFRRADRIIGFNTLRFDVPVLAPYAPPDFAKLNHFDIYNELKLANDSHGASLNAIAKQSIGKGKNDSGENATLYWQLGDAESLAKLEKYCRMDVEITRDVYDFALKNGYLQYIDRWNTPRHIEVDFSYHIKGVSTQPSLF